MAVSALRRFRRGWSFWRGLPLGKRLLLALRACKGRKKGAIRWHG